MQQQPAHMQQQPGQAPPQQQQPQQAQQQPQQAQQQPQPQAAAPQAMAQAAPQQAHQQHQQMQQQQYWAQQQQGAQGPPAFQHDKRAPVGGAMPQPTAGSGEPEVIRNLMVNYIPTTIDEVQLRQLFEMYGPVESVKIVVDRDTRTSKGYGFVKYRMAVSATYAIHFLNGYPLMNKRLKVAFSQQAEAQKILLMQQQPGVDPAAAGAYPGMQGPVAGAQAPPQAPLGGAPPRQW